MVARAELAEAAARSCFFRERGAGENVVDAPADVPLAQVAPRRPPGEEAVVVRGELPAEVDQPAREELREQLAFERSGSDLVLLAQLRVHVALLARHVQVSAEQQPDALGLRGRGELLQPLEESDLGWQVLRAVRDVDRGEQQISQARGHDARLVIELRMREARAAGEGGLAQVQGNARVALEAVPEEPVVAQIAEGSGDVLGRSLDLLQAERVRRFALDVLEHLRGAGADAVDVPGGDLQGHRGPWNERRNPEGFRLTAQRRRRGGFADAADGWTLLLLLEFSIHHVILFRPARLSAGLATRLGAGRAACLARRSTGGLVRLLRHPVRGLHERLAGALDGLDVGAGQRVADRLHLRFQLALRRRRDLVAQVLEGLLRRVGEVVGAVADLDLLAPLLVLGLVGLRLLDGAFHVVLRETGAGGDGDLVLLARGAVPRGHVHDAVRVDVEGHLDLRDAARSGRDPVEMELAQRLVVARHRPLALEHVHLDAGLPVSRRAEHLRLLRRNRGVALDQLRGHASQRLDGEGQRGDVEKQDVLDLAGQHATLHGRADRDHLVRVHRPVRLLAEEVLDDLLQLRHAGRAAYQDDFVDLLRVLLRVREALLRRLQRALEQVLAHLLELRAGEPLDEVLGARLVGGEEREIDLRLHRAGELDLRLLGRLLQALEDHLVLAHVDAGLGAELLDQPVHDLLIHVVAAEVRVAVGGDHLDHVLADLQDGDVEGAAAVVEDGNDLVLLLVQSVGQRGRRGLVDDAAHFQPRDAAGVLGRLALGVVEVRGHGDDRLAHGLAEVVLGGPLQLLQDLRADLRRAPLLSLDVHHGVAVVRPDDLERNTPALVGRLLELAPHEALDRVDGVLRIGDRLAAGDLADEDLAVLAEADDGRGEPVAFLVLDHLRVAAFHDRDHGVRRPEVDSNDLLRHFPCSPSTRARPIGLPRCGARVSTGRGLSRNARGSCAGRRTHRRQVRPRAAIGSRGNGRSLARGVGGSRRVPAESSSRCSRRSAAAIHGLRRCSPTKPAWWERCTTPASSPRSTTWRPRSTAPSSCWSSSTARRFGPSSRFRADRFGSASEMAAALLHACPPPSDPDRALAEWLRRYARDALVQTRGAASVVPRSDPPPAGEPVGNDVRRVETAGPLFAAVPAPRRRALKVAAAGAGP